MKFLGQFPQKKAKDIEHIMSKSYPLNYINAGQPKHLPQLS